MSFGPPPTASDALRHARGIPLSALVPASLFLLAIFGMPARSEASASQYVELQWSASEDCADATTVLRAIDAQLGTAFLTDTRLHASAQVIEHDQQHYELLIDYTTNVGTHDQRRIDGESCAATIDAAAVVLTLALNPSPLEPKPESKPSVPALAAAGQSKSEARAPETPTWSVGALALLDTAVMSRTALGGGLRLSGGFGSLQLDLAANYFLPQDVAYRSIETRLRFWSVDLGACYMSRWAAVAMGPCAQLEMGQLAGAAHGPIDAARSGAARLQALRLGAEIRVRLYAPLWLALTGSGEWIARRPQFVVVDVATVSSPAVFGARIELGPLLVWE